MRRAIHYGPGSVREPVSAVVKTAAERTARQETRREREGSNKGKQTREGAPDPRAFTIANTISQII